MPVPTGIIVPSATHGCAGCAALRAEVGTDPDLHAFYRSKLLIRGWSGTNTPAEKAYQRAHAP